MYRILSIASISYKSYPFLLNLYATPYIRKYPLDLRSNQEGIFLLDIF